MIWVVGVMYRGLVIMPTGVVSPRSSCFRRLCPQQEGHGQQARQRDKRHSAKAFHRILQAWDFVMAGLIDLLTNSYGLEGRCDTEGHKSRNLPDRSPIEVSHPEAMAERLARSWLP